MLALFLALLVSGARAETPALVDACTKGNADACATLGTQAYDKDKEKGGDYFRRACDLGKESSCVFYDSKHPRPTGKVPAVPATAPAKPDGDAKLIAWINRNVPDLLLALYPVRSVGNAGHFSLDSCRIPDAKLAQLVLKAIQVYHHKFELKKGCDAEGALDVQLDKAYPLDLKVREFGGVARLKGTVTTTVKLTPATSEVIQKTLIRDGVAYDEKGGIFARYELTHDRTISLNLLQLKVATLENIGHVKVTEFEGLPVLHEHGFVLDHVDR